MVRVNAKYRVVDTYMKATFPIYENGNVYIKTPNHIHIDYNMDIKE